MRAEWISPPEFWLLMPGEVWWIIEARIAADQRRAAEADAEIYAMLMDE